MIYTNYTYGDLMDGLLLLNRYPHYTFLGFRLSIHGFRWRENASGSWVPKFDSPGFGGHILGTNPDAHCMDFMPEQFYTILLFNLGET